jgi:hypothetical protein
VGAFRLVALLKSDRKGDEVAVKRELRALQRALEGSAA